MKKTELIDRGISPVKRVGKLPLKIKIGALIVLLVIGWFVKPFIFKTSSTSQYQTATAEKGTLISNVTASGSISSAPGGSITTSATGTVEKVYVKNGDFVNQGDTIALLVLDQPSLQKQTAAWANYLSAQNALNSAKSKMNSLQSELFSANQKFVNGAGTKDPVYDDPTYIIQHADWLQAEADYNNQKNVIAQAEAGLSSAWLSYAQISSTITVPMSGIISNLAFVPGQTIAASSPSTNTTTSSLQSYGAIVQEGTKIQAVVNLTEIDVTKVAVGQKVTLTLDAFPDKTFTGKVTAINTNGTVTSGVTIYPVTIDFDSALKTIYPNMNVNANIITGIIDNVILVPGSAVQIADGESTVRVMKNNEITSVMVETGESNDTQTEILAGVNEGDVVVIGETTNTTQGSASPFGGTGFGGRGGGGGQFFIQRR